MYNKEGVLEKAPSLSFFLKLNRIFGNF